MGQRRRYFHRIWRLIKLRLLVPLMRSPHPPEYTAWGTAVGLAWAFTPTPGIQMGLVLLTWLAARHVFNWHFSLVLGAAWTWASNIFTGPPMLYLSYATGQVLLGRWDNITGYAGFTRLWQSAFAADLPLQQQVMTALKMAIKDWGLALWIGCIPWCVLLGVLGYYWSLRFITAYRHARARRLARRLGVDA
ncbi:DUF2062 domain-containing protein [Dongia sedimenti]|uniref:DUF2062 domain-containing protein n=1 Tax=Dongia sedimenti TaxID=3064282 RepID=A0ABU0YNC2_9PROT|nr:DUF2062 domain-containing protein [Rhodospirillaceae bacterium R-7]